MIPKPLMRKEAEMGRFSLFCALVFIGAVACARQGHNDGANEPDDPYPMLADHDVGLAPFEPSYVTLVSGEKFYIRTNCTGIDDQGKIQCDVYYPIDTLIVPESCVWVHDGYRAYAGEDLKKHELSAGYIECQTK